MLIDEEKKYCTILPILVYCGGSADAVVECNILHLILECCGANIIVVVSTWYIFYRKNSFQKEFFGVYTYQYTY